MGYQASVSGGNGTITAMSASSYAAARNIAFTVDTDGIIFLPESSEQYSECNVLLRQAPGGGFVARFAGNVEWSGGVEPQPPLNPGDFAHYRCVSVDYGQTWAASQLAPPTQPRVFDRFSRANSATSLGSAEVGGAWTSNSGVWGVIAGAAYCVTRVGDTIATIDTGTANHYVSCRITPGFSQSAPGLVFRFLDTSNFFVLNLSNPSASPQVAALWKNVAGSWTLVGSVNSFGNIITTGQSTLWGVACDGTSIKLYANGIQILNVTDPSLQTATRAGMRINDANIAGCRWNDFVVVA